MSLRILFRPLVPAGLAAALLLSASPARPTIKKTEKHFAVTGRPVVCIHNIGNGRVEVKSAKNSEVSVLATQATDKVTIDIEQVGDRIDVTSIVMYLAATPADSQVNFQLVVPEETELQLKTQTGLIYVE